MAAKGHVAVLLKGYPRLSETFIARELEALEARGLNMILWSLRRPSDGLRHPVHDRIKAHVIYLPEYLHEERARVWAAWRRARKMPGYGKALRMFLADLARDFSRNRIRRFGQALIFAAETLSKPRLIYAHFIHTPASVARYASAILGVPYAASAHARDIFTTPDWDLRAKLKNARFVSVCTQEGHDRLSALKAGRVQLNRHGIDAAQWPEREGRALRDGRDPKDPVQILSVGRLVEKKGYDVLLAALGLLPRDLSWRLTHIGSGKLRAQMQAYAESLGLKNRIRFRGPRSEPDVIEAMQHADLFALTPKVARDGDRDGIPNVLVEAGASGLACAATRLPGVEEIIVHGETGFLSPPGDAAAFAQSLAQLIGDPALRRRMGASARTRVLESFEAEQGFNAVARLIAGAMTPPPR